VLALVIGGAFELGNLGLIFYAVHKIKPQSLRFKADLGTIFGVETELRLRDTNSLLEGHRHDM
jgi:hypothetical protein